MAEEAELTPKNIDSINRDFYAGSPWTYFQQRLCHLMLVAAHDERLRQALADGVTVEGITLRVDSPEVPDTYPTPEQSFVAVELEVLLHHVAETLLRFVHAHADVGERCPSIRLARLTSPRQFKEWVTEHVRTASDQDLARLCVRVFACDSADGESNAAYVDHLRLLARHFLEADSYNAAKHGMALQGGSQRFELALDDWKLISRDGAQVSWIARWPRRDPKRPARWTRGGRLLSEGAGIALIHMATQMMESIWLRARARYLGDDTQTVFRPSSLQMLFEALGVRHHVLVETFQPFSPEGEKEDLVVRSAHFEVPETTVPDEASGGSEAELPADA